MLHPSIILIPLLGALFIIVSRSKNVNSTISIALFTSLVNFLLCLFLWYLFDETTTEFQFLDNQVEWDSSANKYFFKDIVAENNIKGIIIGNPLNMDGSLGKSAQSVKDTSQNIEKSINIPICLWDERLSTVGAFNISSQLDINVSKREKKIDENAATFILQGAIDFLNN